MTIRSGFFNSVAGDRKYDASKFAEYFASFVGNGVFPNPANNLQVMSNDDMTVTVKAGKAWIDGYIMINDDDYILNIDAADGVLNRIDRVVARLDIVDREIRIEVKKGTFASSPVAPSLQRDADAYELALADILVSAGVVGIVTDKITDLRDNSDLCGKVDSLIAGDINALAADLVAHKADNVHIPKGLISMWSGLISEIPDGWVLCDGNNGTPNLKDRFIMGAVTDATINKTGGQNEVTLTVEQMPSHSHSGSTGIGGSHTHNVTVVDGVGGSYNHPPLQGSPTRTSQTTNSAGSHSHSLSINNTGEGQPHENRPAFYKLAFIMKV